MRTRVKICGITRPEDAVAVANAGADAIGLVFYPKSSRFVSAVQASEIIEALPPFVAVVGLFLDARSADIESLLKTVKLSLLQFHGDECPADCSEFALPYIKAVGMSGHANYRAYADCYKDTQGILLDSHAPGAAGGTGETFDWTNVPQDYPKPLILAGGLTPDNIAAAIQTARPYGVDLSSGVESAPGIKDAGKIQALMNEVRRVDCQR